jgi:hypothetical protein
MMTSRLLSPSRSLCYHTHAYNTHSAWLIIWTLNNIGVTLLNKAAFQTVDFHYPYFLSAVHMVCNSLGSQLVFWSVDRAKASNDAGAVDANPVTKLLGVINRQHLDAKGKRLILAFSVIFSLNIAIGNVSLKYVSVNFNQVRAAQRAGVYCWLVVGRVYWDFVARTVESATCLSP